MGTRDLEKSTLKTEAIDILVSEVSTNHPSISISRENLSSNPFIAQPEKENKFVNIKPAVVRSAQLANRHSVSVTMTNQIYSFTEPLEQIYHLGIPVRENAEHSWERRRSTLVTMLDSKSGSRRESHTSEIINTNSR